MTSTRETLTIGVAQLATEATLEQNLDKILRFVSKAKAAGCRVLVTPEEALHSPPDTRRTDIDAAVHAVQTSAGENDTYVILGLRYRLTDAEPQHCRQLTIGPDGSVVQCYDKLYGDARFAKVPGIFPIDGIACCTAICADRWIRGVEELPAFAGAQILFECSNNYACEWISDLGWYWYVPRALRNGCYVVFCNAPWHRPGIADAGFGPGHGHSAVVAPDGSFVAAAGGEPDELLVAAVDLSQATRAEARRRHDHPLLKRFWDTGIQIMGGATVEAPPFAPLTSPEIPIALCAAQMACSRSVADNLARMRQMLQEAKARGAQVVAFPALAVTGGRDEDVLAAEPEVLEGALREVQAMARALRLNVAFGMPHVHPDGQRTNSAFVVDPDGALLTRYDQLVVDRPYLFSPGLSSKAMWFDCLGVPAVVTVGRDALWSELAELAAIRGAQLHLHLCYDQATSPQGALLRRQLWANLASFRTFTATVNAAAPGAGPWASASAGGGSMLWEDMHRAHSGEGGNHAPYSALCLAEAGPYQQLLCATQRVLAVNPQFAAMTDTTNPQMKAWYIAGAHAIFDTLEEE